MSILETKLSDALWLLMFSVMWLKEKVLEFIWSYSTFLCLLKGDYWNW